MRLLFWFLFLPSFFFLIVFSFCLTALWYNVSVDRPTVTWTWTGCSNSHWDWSACRKSETFDWVTIKWHVGQLVSIYIYIYLFGCWHVGLAGTWGVCSSGALKLMLLIFKIRLKVLEWVTGGLKFFDIWGAAGGPRGDWPADKTSLVVSLERNDTIE